MSDLKTIREALAAPFPEGELKRKPQAVQGDRALAICYIDARSVCDRLDAVLGMDGWKDSYEALPDGTVVCRLSVKVGKSWLTKEDVGGISGACPLPNRMKAAYSDALKRAAVKWGIGRYLYRLPQEWLPYDRQKKCFVGSEPAPRKSSKPSVNGRRQPAGPPQAPQQPQAPAAPPAPAPAAPAPGKATAEQIAEVIRLRGLLQVPDEAWRAIVAKRGVQSARELSEAQATELIGALQFRVTTDQLQAALGAHQVQDGLAADGLAAPGEPDFRPVAS